MKYRVIVGGILKRNGQLAPFNTELDEGELDDASARVKEGYVEEVGEDVPAKDSTDAPPADDAPPAGGDQVSTGNDLIDAAKGKKP